jgi:hypothetical protein
MRGEVVTACRFHAAGLRIVASFAFLLLVVAPRPSAATAYTIDFEQFAAGDPITEVITPLGSVTFGPTAASVLSAAPGSTFLPSAWTSVTFPSGVTGFSLELVDDGLPQIFGALFPVLRIEGDLRPPTGDFGCEFSGDPTCLLSFLDRGPVAACLGSSSFSGLDCATSEWGGLFQQSSHRAGIDDLTLVTADAEPAIPEPTGAWIFAAGLTLVRFLVPREKNR